MKRRENRQFIVDYDFYVFIVAWRSDVFHLLVWMWASVCAVPCPQYTVLLTYSVCYCFRFDPIFNDENRTQQNRKKRTHKIRNDCWSQRWKRWWCLDSLFFVHSCVRSFRSGIFSSFSLFFQRRVSNACSDIYLQNTKPAYYYKLRMRAPCKGLDLFLFFCSFSIFTFWFLSKFPNIHFMCLRFKYKIQTDCYHIIFVVGDVFMHEFKQSKWKVPKTFYKNKKKNKTNFSFEFSCDVRSEFFCFGFAFFFSGCLFFSLPFACVKCKRAIISKDENQKKEEKKRNGNGRRNRLKLEEAHHIASEREKMLLFLVDIRIRQHTKRVPGKKKRTKIKQANPIDVFMCGTYVLYILNKLSQSTMVGVSKNLFFIRRFVT